MLIALRDMSLGDHVIERGGHIPADVQDTLPPGRVEALKAQRWVEEITDEQRIGRVVDDLLALSEKRIVALEARVARLEGGGGSAGAATTYVSGGSGGSGGAYVIDPATSTTGGGAGNITVTSITEPVKLTKSGKVDGRTKAARQMRKAS